MREPFFTTDVAGDQQGNCSILEPHDIVIISLFPVIAINHSLDAVTEVGHVKVNQKTHSLLAYLMYRE
jgi:hypothetical protein